MRVLQILVWLLLFMLTYDIFTYFLQVHNQNENTSKSGEGAKVKRNSSTSYIAFNPGQVLPFQWILGGCCLALIFLLRFVLTRPSLKSVDILKGLQKVSNRVRRPVKKESFLTCKPSDISVDPVDDDDSASHLNVEQLHVLMEDLKFRADEKFDEIENWIEANELESKQWIKRLERAEAELSFIHHQLFALLTNLRLGSSSGQTDIPDTQVHVETLRELSRILNQVKHQFEEVKGKEETTTGEETGGSELDLPEPMIVIKEVRDDSTDQSIENQIWDSDRITSEDNSRQEMTCESSFETDKVDLELKDLSRTSLSESKEIITCEVEPESVPVELEIDSSRTNEIKASSINIVPEAEPKSQMALDKEKKEETNEKGDLKDAYKRNCLRSVDSRRSRTASEKHVEFIDNPEVARLEPVRCPDERGDYPSVINEKLDVLISGVSESAKPSFEEELRGDSLNILVDYAEQEKSAKAECSDVKDKEVIDPARGGSIPRPSPKRSVRFAQEKREASPSKSPTWLGIKRDESPSKKRDIRGTSEPKVTTCSGDEVRRESVSLCPLVENKKDSRRTIMQRELMNLERRASPTRQRQPRRNNATSKVREYILGIK